MSDQFILIPGRSSRQGVTLNEGKYTDGYKTEINTLRMHPDDMSRLSLTPGDEVWMWNDVGEVVVPVVSGGDELPLGMVFICYGDKSSQLMGAETHGSGMPDSKGLDVFLEKHVTGQPRGHQPAATEATEPGLQPVASGKEQETESPNRPTSSAKIVTTTKRPEPSAQSPSQNDTSAAALGVVVIAIATLLWCLGQLLL